MRSSRCTADLARNACFIWLTFCFLASGFLPVASKKSNKCAVFDAFKVLPENSTNYVGGAFGLHKQDCNTIIGESVQEIVALQWVFAHWNNAQKAQTSRVGLFVGDSCNRASEATLQTLRFLDFVNFYEPKECLKKTRNSSMTGILSPKDRTSASAVAGLLQSTNLLVGAYTPESVEALLKGGVKRVLTTSAVIEDYIAAFSALVSALESDLVIVVTCDEENPRLEIVLQLLNDHEIYVSEVIHVRHNLIADVLGNTDSNILLYLPCDDTPGDFMPLKINNGPKLLITIGIGDSDAHFPYRINNAQEVIIRQIQADLLQFKPYFLRILANNYDSYALASSYIQQVINCSFAEKTCPAINMETLSNMYVQGKNVYSIVRLAYAFAVASRFIDVNDKLKSACAQPSLECTDGIFQQLSSMRFLNEKHSPLELTSEELGFFAKSPNLLQSIGLRLEAVLGGSEEVFKYVIARESKLISKDMPSSIKWVRSICQPYRTYCGNCEHTVLADPKTTFLANQFVSSFYLAALFNLHGSKCENIRQKSIINAIAVIYTLNTINQEHPNLTLKPLKDYGTFIFDSCSDSYQARHFSITTETQCLKLPMTEYNVSIPASTILSYISTLDEPNNQAALLRGMHVPAVTMDAASPQQDGVVGLLPPPRRTATAVAEFLQSMQWSYISIVVSSSESRCLDDFEAFMSLANDYNLCVGNVLFYSSLNRSRLNAHQASTNVTVFFTSSADAVEFASTQLRFNVDLTNNIDVMVNSAQDFLVYDPSILQLQHVGTVAIRPKDILPFGFKEYLQNVTPLSLSEQWFWSYVEKQWRCALSLHNRAEYDGRLCTGNEHLNLLEFGQLADAGILIRGTERLVLAIDRAYRKACHSETNIGFCETFLANGRRLIREELDADNFEVEFQVDEFQPIDHHGNMGYKLIGNFTLDLKYVEVEEYRVFTAGIPKYDTQHKSVCTPPLCICKQGSQLAKAAVLPSDLNGRHGSIRWFQKASLLLDWENNTLNYVFLGIASTVTLLAVSTLFLVLYKIYTRAIKGNQSLGVLLLVAILLLNFTTFFYILDINNELYELRTLLNGLAHVICFGIALVKAVRLRNFEDIINKRKLQIALNYWLLLLFIISVQLAILCHGLDLTDSREFISQSYTTFLLLIVLLINVQNRKILRNYKESTWLFITSVFALALYVSWLITRTVFTPEYTRQIDILELLLLSLILLVFLFGPKLYILFLYEGVVVERCATPPKNTVFEDDLFATNSPYLSPRLNLSRKDSIGHKSVSTVTADEFPVLKTVMRKREFTPSRHSSDRNSNVSTSSS